MPEGPTSHKIKKLGTEAEKLVNRLRAEGKGYRSIAKKVEEVFDVSVSHTAVQNYLKEEANIRAQRMGEEEMRKLEKKKTEKILEIGSQLKELNEKLQRVLRSLDETDPSKVKLIVDVAKEIREQLKFHRRYLEQISEPDTQINLNKTQVAIKVNRELSRLESQGVIEIKKPDKWKEQG